jgi:hypothetical protein
MFGLVMVEIWKPNLAQEKKKRRLEKEKNYSNKFGLK